jgi:nucleotide-binding universal stress UspA family protein
MVGVNGRCERRAKRRAVPLDDDAPGEVTARAVVEVMRPSPRGDRVLPDAVEGVVEDAHIARVPGEEEGVRVETRERAPRDGELLGALDLPNEGRTAG